MDTHALINRLLEAEDTSGITFKPHRESGYGGNRVQIANMYLGFPAAELAVAYYQAVSGDPSDRRA